MKIIQSKNIIKDAINGGLIGVGISSAILLISNGFTLNPIFWISNIIFGFLVGFLITAGNALVFNAFLKFFPDHNLPLFPLLLIIYFVSVIVFYSFSSLCNIFIVVISPQEISPQEIFFVSLGVGISCVITSFFFIFTEEKIELLRLEKENRKLAVIGERNRIARELHDSVSQNLYGINLSLNNLDHVLSENPKEARKITKLILGMVEEVQREMRLMIYELKPNALSEKGFLEAIKDLVNLFKIRYNINIRCQINGNEDFLDDQKQLTCYRILQESLNNIIKHAGATKVIVILKFSEKENILTVQDNGKGILTTEIDKNKHLGIKGMKERVEQIKGTFEILSSPGKGTTVCVKF